MNKLIVGVPLAVMMMVGVFAFGGFLSLRGTGGNINNIQNDSSFSFSKISFNAGTQETHGKGTLQVTSIASDDGRVNLGVNFKQTSVSNPEPLVSVVAGEGTGIYWKNGKTRVLVLTEVSYTFSGITHMANISGNGYYKLNATAMTSFNFAISNISIKRP